MEVQQVPDTIKIEREPDPPKLTKTQLQKLEKKQKREEAIKQAESETISIQEEFDDYTTLIDQKQEASEGVDAVVLLQKQIERLTLRLDMLEERMTTVKGPKYSFIFN
jgi:hypothetical protein